MYDKVVRNLTSKYNIEYLDDLSIAEISNAVFGSVQAVSRELPKNGDTVLFLDIDSNLRYRNNISLSIDSLEVYNAYNWVLPVSDVAVYKGNPEDIKNLITDIDMRGASYIVPTIETKKELTTMSTLNKMIEMNKQSAVNAGKLELGKSTNKLVLNKIAPQLPMMVRGYADSPLAELVIANVVAGLLTQFAGDNPKAVILSEAMVSAGAQVAIESFNIPELLNELLSNVAIPSVEAED